MTKTEREMIYEINLVRSNSKVYIRILDSMLKVADQTLRDYGKGYKNYSLTISSNEKDGKTIVTTDTTWHYTNEEQLKAISTLIDDLKKSGRLSILNPDEGIYKAATKHVNDQKAHNWALMHKEVMAHNHGIVF